MNIPEQLQEAIETEAANYDWNAVLEAREKLTEAYRQPKKQNFITSEAQRCAYVVARLPATYAVISYVLQEASSRLTGDPIKSLLDLGAGPGSVMWAASEIFPSLTHITLFERDHRLATMGKKFASYSHHSAVRTAQWQMDDLEKFTDFSPHDLMIFSYSVGELSPSAVPSLLTDCWKVTRKALIVIEPGTPAGFERIRIIRNHLLSLGAHLLAPCPHSLSCPMSGGDWCHFSKRVERSSLHRRIKGGTLGYEDEKFSYIVVSKEPCMLPHARVLRHPLKRSGHINITSCTQEGLKQETISKRHPEVYKQARKLEWGDAVDLPCL